MLPRDFTIREGSMKYVSVVGAVLGLALAASALPGFAQSKPQVPKLGLWEITTAVAGGKTDVDRICLTEEDLSEWNLFRRVEPECKEQCKIGNGNIDCNSTCKYGKTVVTGKASGTYDATAYKLNLQATTGGKTGGSVAISGRYLAPQCGTIK
jgi:hypothetical protein